jgi:WXXGXW repeat (2 copies)
MTLNYLLVPLFIAAAVPTMGCTVSTRPATEVAYVDAEPPPPPAPEVEVIPVAPGPEFIWVAGHHRWTGHGYVWVGGHYDRRPNRDAHYVRGHWEHRGRTTVWVDGHWV